MIPVGARRIARSYRRRDGVVGVFWGMTFKDGAWRDDRAIVVHVESPDVAGALEPARGLMESDGPLKVEFQVTGRPGATTGNSATVLTWSANGTWTRESTITVVAPSGKEFLMCGHGGLPIRDGRLVSPGTVDASRRRVEVKLPGGSAFGEVVDGRSQGRFDWARVVLTDGKVPTAHPIGGFPRFQVAPDSTREVGDTVKLWSAMGGGVVKGIIRQVALTSVDMDLPTGEVREYRDVYFVAGPDGGPISVDGDSGAAVWDGWSRPIGAILGRGFYGAEAGTYVISNQAIAWTFNSYFRE